jgi:pyrroline-5-carboxylate reductase
MTIDQIEEYIDVQIEIARMMPARAILSIEAISTLRDMSKELQATKKLIESV